MGVSGTRKQCVRDTPHPRWGALHHNCRLHHIPGFCTTYDGGVNADALNRTAYISDNLPFLKAFDTGSVDLVVIPRPPRLAEAGRRSIRRRHEGVKMAISLTARVLLWIGLAVLVASCDSETPRPVEVIVGKEVVKTVEVPVEVIVEKEVVKEVEIPVEVIKEVEVVKWSVGCTEG